MLVSLSPYGEPLSAASTQFFEVIMNKLKSELYKLLVGLVGLFLLGFITKCLWIVFAAGWNMIGG